MTRQPTRRGRTFGVAIAAVTVVGSLMVGAMPAHADAVRDAEYWLESYGVSAAWNTTRGEGTTIAVIDTGIAAGPAEFNGAVVGGFDASGVGSPDGRTPVGSASENPHGSWVASLAAGRGNGESNGVIGTAPAANLLSISVGFGSSGSTVPFDEQVAEGVRWAVDNGADVINMSLTTNTKDWPESWDDAFLYAYENNVVIVAAAGNRGSGTDVVGAPATIPGVLTVAGVNKDGAASEGASTQGITLGVAAPSEELVGASPDGSYVQWAGTSGASPIVAGIAALVIAAHPDLDTANVINRIVSTARPAPDGNALLYGNGYVDAAAAVTADVPHVDENPMGSLEDWVTLNRRQESTSTPIPVDYGEVPPVPPVSDSAAAHNPFLPTRDSLLYVSLPLAVFLGTASLAVLGAIGATRQFRRAARK
ncbi:S8 family peptidase [Okibacterium endophyticum]